MINQLNPAPIPVNAQLSSLLITTEDITAAFKFFFNRLPSADDDISSLKNCESDYLLTWFLNSPEFLGRTGSDTLILNIASKIQDHLKTKK